MVLLRDEYESLSEHLSSEARNGNSPSRLLSLGVVLTMGGLALRDKMVPQMRTVAEETVTSTSHLRIAKHLADARRRSEHDLDALLQLSVRRWPGEPGTAPPTACGVADRLDRR